MNQSQRVPNSRPQEIERNLQQSQLNELYFSRVIPLIPRGLPKTLSLGRPDRASVVFYIAGRRMFFAPSGKYIPHRQDPGGIAPRNPLFATKRQEFPPGSWRFDFMEAITNESYDAGAWIGRQQAFAFGTTLDKMSHFVESLFFLCRSLNGGGLDVYCV